MIIVETLLDLSLGGSKKFSNWELRELCCRLPARARGFCRYCSFFTWERHSERGKKSSDVCFQFEVNWGIGLFCWECTKEKKTHYGKGAKNLRRGWIARSVARIALNTGMRQAPLRLQPEGLIPAPTLVESEAEDIEQAGLSRNFQFSICCSWLPGCIMLIKPLLSKWWL